VFFSSLGWDSWGDIVSQGSRCGGGGGEVVASAAPEHRGSMYLSVL